jgi:hypothetical protein
MHVLLVLDACLLLTLFQHYRIANIKTTKRSPHDHRAEYQNISFVVYFFINLVQCVRFSAF